MITQKGMEFTTATVGEGALVLVMAAAGWATKQPLIFASLGPTAYELVEKPKDPSSRAYNIIVGHLVGLGAGFLAVYLLNAWQEPNVPLTGIVSATRVWAVVIGAVLTTLGTLLLRARQPAATATALLVALGSMQTKHDALVMVIAVLVITAIGEPVRRVRMKLVEERKTRLAPQ